MESLGRKPGALPSGAWFSSWYVVSIDTGHRAQSPQSAPRQSPAFKMEPVLSISSFTTSAPGGKQACSRRCPQTEFLSSGSGCLETVPLETCLELQGSRDERHPLPRSLAQADALSAHPYPSPPPKPTRRAAFQPRTRQESCQKIEGSLPPASPGLCPAGMHCVCPQRG